MKIRGASCAKALQAHKRLLCWRWHTRLPRGPDTGCRPCNGSPLRQLAAVWTCARNVVDMGATIFAFVAEDRIMAMRERMCASPVHPPCLFNKRS